MIVLDATVLIAFLNPDDVHHHDADEFILRAIGDGQELAINPVTLAEVLVLPTREGRVDNLVAELGNLGVLEAPFPPDASRALARLRVAGLKMPDCCVLLTAMDRGAALVSFDDRLVGAATQQQVAVHRFE